MVNPNNLTRTSNFRVFLPILQNEIIYCQGVTLPGLTLTPTQGYNRGLKLNLEGDDYTLDPVTLTLIVDEDYKLPKRIYNLFKDIVHPNNGAIAPNFNFECSIDITNNSGITVFGLELHTCALQNITPITLLSNTEDDIITIDLSIEPSYYEIIESIEDGELYKRIING